MIRRLLICCAFVVAVQAFLGESPAPVDYTQVPWVVYTHPEVAWAGMTEAEARAAGHDVVVHKHSFAGNGRAMIIGETDGMVKVVAAKDGPILGFHLVGPWASELLAEPRRRPAWSATTAAAAARNQPAYGRVAVASRQPAIIGTSAR